MPCELTRCAASFLGPAHTCGFLKHEFEPVSTLRQSLSDILNITIAFSAVQNRLAFEPRSHLHLSTPFSSGNALRLHSPHDTRRSMIAPSIAWAARGSQVRTIRCTGHHCMLSTETQRILENLAVLTVAHASVGAWTVERPVGKPPQRFVVNSI